MERLSEATLLSNNEFYFSVRRLETIDSLMGAAPDTPEEDWLEVLVTLVEAYEARRWPVEAPDPVAMIEHATEARGYRQKDLAAVVGSPPHASEVLGRRRPLTLPIIRALSAEWKIPADVLVREYAVRSRALDAKKFPVVLSEC